jgi:hypothetical protein
VGGASVLRATVKHQWDTDLEDPAVHMVVKETNADDGYNNPLHWWKELYTKYSYIWQFARRICVLLRRLPQVSVFSAVEVTLYLVRGATWPLVW